jgi:hypothetical protein
MADQTYLDRLYDEIGQYGDRLARTVRGPYGFSEVSKNWTTPYETPERRQEAMRLAAQQAKEEYMAQQNAGQLSLKDARESQQIREDIGKRLQTLGPEASYLAEQERLRMQAAKEGYMAQQDPAQTPAQGYQQPGIPGLDPYAQYLQENAVALQGPYLPQDQYAAPTREEYQKYFVEGQAPAKAELSRPAEIIPAPPAVAEMAAVMPRRPQPSPAATPALMPVAAQEVAATQQPGQQRQRTVMDAINEIPYEADRHEAKREVIERARLNKINELHQYAGELAQQGYPTSDLRGFVEMKLKQIDENYKAPKPFEESAQFKGAEKNWDGGLRDRQKRLVAAYNVVKESQNLMDQDPEKALLFMRSSMAKPLQSIISSDAIQVSEMLIQYQDLLNTPTFAQLTGKQPTNPAILYNKYLSLDDKEKNSFRENLVRAMVEANPKRALENAIYTVNSYVDGYNKDIKDQVIDPTSPRVAKNLGVVAFEPLQNRQPKGDLPAMYPQVGTPAPAQQKSAVPLDIEAMRARYKTK